MIRILLDEHGAYTKDLFVKIDAMVSKVLIADTGWLYDFFETYGDNPGTWPLNEEQVLTAQKKNVALLIHMWINSLLSDEPVCYLPVDLSDQSSLALRVTKAENLFSICEASTTDSIDGTTETYFSKNQHSFTWNVDRDEQWAIAPESILTGLNWSLARLQLPSIPLKYDIVG